jgi:gamma-glutamyl phosphate reductase
LEETVIERLKIEEEKIRNLYEEYKKIILLKKDVEEVKELYRKNKEIIKMEEEE